MAVKFSQEIFDTICERIAGGESLRSICLDDDMPTWKSVIRWLGDPKNGSLRDQYARAREEQADKLFDEIVEIADTSGSEDVQKARLRIDARKWVAGKLRPKKYGERLEMHGAGENGEHIHRIEAAERDARDFASAIASLAARRSAAGED